MIPKLFIKRVSDGEIRPSSWPPDSRYYWEEGNASCDCNRALAFGDEDDSMNCGESRYTLVNEDGSPFTDWPEENL